MTDPLWSSYVDAVGQLARLPERGDHLRGRATAAEQETYRRAQADLDAVTRQCAAWNDEVRRALETAEAKLVQANILLPDAAAATPLAGEPAALSNVLREAGRELDADLAGLELARRRAKDDAQRAAFVAKQRADLRRGIVLFAGVGAVVVLAILVIAVLAG